MSNTHFQFKQFRVEQDRCGMKVTTDACLFGAVVAERIVQRGPASILDIGTGTGLLALMLAQVSDCPVEAIELDEGAFKQASDNFNRSPWHSRLKAHHTPLQAFEQKAFDLIICNPPFFANHQQGRQQNKSQALHNDRLPLADLAKGLEDNLSNEGQAFVLLPDHEMGLLSDLLNDAGLHTQHEVTVYNRPGKAVFRRIRAFSKAQTPHQKSELLYIRNENGEYSERFIALLSPYYLHL